MNPRALKEPKVFPRVLKKPAAILKMAKKPEVMPRNSKMLEVTKMALLFLPQPRRDPNIL